MFGYFVPSCDKLNINISWSNPKLWWNTVANVVGIIAHWLAAMFYVHKVIFYGKLMIDVSNSFQQQYVKGSEWVT